MPLEAGEDVLGTPTIESRDWADGVSAGDAVGINGSGDLAAADSDSSIEATGIAAEGGGHLIAGVAVANVEDDVSAGDRVDTPDDSLAAEDAGALTQSGTGRWKLLSDEGGTFQGMSVPDGYAAVVVS